MISLRELCLINLNKYEKIEIDEIISEMMFEYNKQIFDKNNKLVKTQLHLFFSMKNNVYIYSTNNELYVFVDRFDVYDVGVSYHIIMNFIENENVTCDILIKYIFVKYLYLLSVYIEEDYHDDMENFSILNNIDLRNIVNTYAYISNNNYTIKNCDKFVIYNHTVDVYIFLYAIEMICNFN